MGVINDMVQNTYQTTDASSNAALIYSFPANSSGKFTANVLAVDPSTQNTAGFELKFMAKRVNGSCIIVGTVTNTMPLASDLLLATASVSASVFGSSVVINVVGVALTTLNWDLQMQVRIDAP